MPLLLLLLLVSLLSTPSLSFPLSTIAITHGFNKTIVCSLFPSRANSPYDLNCTSFPSNRSHSTHSYPSGSTLYSAITAGDDFLCALGSLPSSPALSTMRWWDFTAPTTPTKRVYQGPRLSALSAAHSHVCGLLADTRRLFCWRWPHLRIPPALNFTSVASGRDFVCGLLDSGPIRCFGNDTGVVSRVPSGNYSIVAAGVCHACAVSTDGYLRCWGDGAPEIGGSSLVGVTSLALGENRTCARYGNATVSCWGDGAQLPADFAGAQFMSIQAKGSTLCGVLMADFTLVCWGNEAFRRNHTVFRWVLPGSCANISSCPCGVLAGSAFLCADGGVVCQICRTQLVTVSTNPPPQLPWPPSPRANSTVAPVPVSESKDKKRLLFITSGSIAGALMLAVVLGFVFFWVRRRANRVHSSGRMAAAERPPPPPPPLERRLSAFFGRGATSTVEEFSLQVLQNATDNFSDECRIGSGSFGAVYRARLADGRVVAIKRAEQPAVSSAQTAAVAEGRRRCRESAFVAELALLSRVNHKNLVRLLGFCREAGERVLVFEYVANGSLQDHMQAAAAAVAMSPPPLPPLASWAARLRVALDAARGIEYLHTYAVPPIIHRDIKSSNILLDESWTAKVADFGLSLMNPDAGGGGGGGGDDWLSLEAAGTVGYMDPEYYRLQRLTAKSDVYSFGVVLLELLTGCRAVHRNGDSGTPVNVVELSVPMIEAGDGHRVLDRRLPPPTPSEIEAVAGVGYLAADCVSPQGSDRPTMTEIVGGLERALSMCLAGPRPLFRSTTARSM